MATRTISDAGGNWDDVAAWEEGEVPTSADDVVAQGDESSGNLTINVAAACKSAVFTNYTGTLTHAAAVTWTVSGNLTFVAGMTYTLGNATTSAIAIAATSNLTTAGKVLGNLTLNASGGTLQLQDAVTSTGSFTNSAGTFDANAQVYTLTGSSPTITPTAAITFADLTRTGNAVKTDSLTLAGNITVSGTLTINGNSAVNRMLVKSSVLGTARTFTAATVAVTNADFQDVTGAGAGSWDLSAVAGGIGDCGGNTGITFTTPATQYYYKASGSDNWSTVGNWYLGTGGSGGAGRVPLPHDPPARFDAASFGAASMTVTQDMPRIPGWDFTGATNSPTLTPSTVASVFGSINNTNLGTLTDSTQTYLYEGRGANILTSAGKTWAKAWIIQAPGGTLSLSDALTSTANIAWNVGTINAGANSITAASLLFTEGGTAVVNGSGTITATSQYFEVLTTMTWNHTGPIVMTRVTASQFRGGGKTFAGLTYSPGVGTEGITITGTNTFTGTLTLDGSGAYTVTLPNSTTTVGSMQRSATTNVITLQRTGGSGTATIADSSAGLNILPYMSISNVAVTPPVTWYAPMSTDGGGNTGWSFSYPLSSALRPLRSIRPVGA